MYQPPDDYNLLPHIFDGHKKPKKVKPAVLSEQVRRSLGGRLKARRVFFNMPANLVSKAGGMQHVTYIAWERCLPQKARIDAERKIEEFLQVPEGWIRNPDIVADLPAMAPVNFEDADNISGEIRMIANWLSIKKVYKRTIIYDELPLDAKRASDIFSARYGVNGEEACILQAIGDVYGLTRERVRQITFHMAQRAVELSIPTPLLDQLAIDIKEHLPCTVKDIDIKFRSVLGENLSILSADRFYREVLGKKLIDVTDKPAGMMVAWDLIAYNPDNHAPSNLRVIRDVSHKMIRGCGAAHVHYVTGEASKVLQISMSDKEVRSALALMVGFEWITEDEDWFWFGPTVPAENKVHAVTKKVLVAARRKVDVEDIAQALSRNRREIYEERLTKIPDIEPSNTVIIEILKRTPWVTIVQSDDVALAEFFDENKILSEAELKIHRFLAQRGGVSSRYVLHNELAGDGGMIRGTIDLAIDSSPIFSRVTDGIFMIRGWPVEADSIKTAMDSIRGGNKQNQITALADAEGWISYAFVLTYYIDRLKIIDVPSRVAFFLPVGEYKFEEFADPVVLTRYETGAVRLNQFCAKLIKSGFKIGQNLVISIHPELKKIKVVAAGDVETV